MCAREVRGVLFMGSRRVTANRHENEESGDYSKDISSVHSLSSFLVQPGISQGISMLRRSSF
jgi:hypothetical protein